jgi:hypothetical protein
LQAILPLPAFTGYNFDFDMSASRENNFRKLSAAKIINYFSPKAFVGTVFWFRNKIQSRLKINFPAKKSAGTVALMKVKPAPPLT